MSELSQLQIECLSVVAMPAHSVERIYNHPDGLGISGILQLCLSHERLRAEVDGANALMEEERKYLHAIITELRKEKEDFFEMLEAMKSGVAIRIADLEKQITDQKGAV